MFLQRIGLVGRRLQYFTFCAGALNMLSCGLHLGWSAPYLPELLSETSRIQMTNDEGSWVVVFLLIGSICGSSSGAAFLDILGRKKLILISTVPFLTSWLMIAFSTTFWELCAARFIAGLSHGVSFCTLPLYFSEMSDAEIRGVFLSGATVAYLFGLMLVNFIGTVLNMRTMAFLGAVLPVIVILTVSVLPESPHLHIIHGKLEHARKSLQTFTGKSDVNERLQTIMDSIKQIQESKGKWVQLFSNQTCQRTLGIMLVVRGVHGCSGIVAVAFYLPTIFKDAGEYVSLSTSIVLYYTLQSIFTILLMATIDKIGRKPLLIFSITLVSVSSSVLGVYFAIRNLTNIDVTDLTWIPFVGLLLYSIGYSSGLSCIPVVLIGESFPIEVKSLAICILDMFYSSMSALASKYLQYSKDEFGLHVPFLTFALICICSIPFIVRFVTETKAKTLEEIQNGVKRKEKRESLHHQNK